VPESACTFGPNRFTRNAIDGSVAEHVALGKGPDPFDFAGHAVGRSYVVSDLSYYLGGDMIIFADTDSLQVPSRAVARRTLRARTYCSRVRLRHVIADAP
jgi:hypothetical protein